MRVTIPDSVESSTPGGHNILTMLFQDRRNVGSESAKVLGSIPCRSIGVASLLAKTDEVLSRPLRCVNLLEFACCVFQ